MPIEYRSPTLAQLLRDAISVRLAGIHTAMPGRVESFDAAKQRVNVQIVLSDKLVTANDVETSQFPVISDVPLAFFRIGGFFLSAPVNVGDKVWLQFGERSLDRLLALGYNSDVDPATGAKTTNDPNLRRFSLDDAVAIPADVVTTIQDFSSSALVMGKDGGGPQVAVDGSFAFVGGQTGAQFIALANLVKAELDKIQATLATGSNSGGPVVFGTPYVSSPVAATKAKAV